jgi:molybdenum-dependent DNA-binding transcriptional regulator ModE
MSATLTLKNGTAVLHDARRYRLIQHLIECGGIALADAWQVLGVASYSAAWRHVEALTKADVVGIELEPREGINKDCKTLFVTDTGRRAFEAQRRAFKELAMA